MQIRSENFGFEKNISDKNIIDDFKNFVDVFFVSKSEIIELSKKQSQDPIIANYPSIEVEILLKNGKSIKKHIQIGQEEYEIVYNPKFLEFYKFLDGLVKQK